MSTDFDNMINQIEARVARLEQNSVVPTTGLADVDYDDETDTTVVNDRIDWSAAANGWEPYSSVSPFVFDAVTGEVVSGGELSSPLGRPEAHLIGSVCVLTGVVRRKAGATPNPLAPGTRYNLPMFGLPTSWRPTTNIILPCLVGNTDPLTTAATASIGWIEVRSGLDPLQDSGRVYFVATTLGISPNTGWIALQGVFPCHLIDTSVDAPVENSWDDAHFQSTWDSLADDVAWLNYTSLD